MCSDHRLAHSPSCDEAEVCLVVLAQAVSHSFRPALVQNKQQAVPPVCTVMKPAGEASAQVWEHADEVFCS